MNPPYTPLDRAALVWNGTLQQWDDPEANVLSGRFIICFIGDRCCAVRVDQFDWDVNYGQDYSNTC